MLARAAGWLVPELAALAADDQDRCGRWPFVAFPPRWSRRRAVGRLVIRSGAAFAAADVSTDRRIGTGARLAAVAFPLVCRGRTIGALVGLDRRSRRRPSRDSPPLRRPPSTRCSNRAIALDNAMRVLRAEALSVTDDLTGLYTAGTWRRSCAAKPSAPRSGRPLSLLFGDLRRVQGDQRHARPSVRQPRAGGSGRDHSRHGARDRRRGGFEDEFALVLPDTGSEGGRRFRRAHPGTDRRPSFPPGGWSEHYVDRVGRGRDPTRCGVVGGAAHPGGRQGDVSGEGTRENGIYIAGTEPGE